MPKSEPIPHNESASQPESDFLAMLQAGLQDVISSYHRLVRHGRPIQLSLPELKVDALTRMSDLRSALESRKQALLQEAQRQESRRQHSLPVIDDRAPEIVRSAYYDVEGVLAHFFSCPVYQLAHIEDFGYYEDLNGESLDYLQKELDAMIGHTDQLIEHLKAHRYN